MAASSGCFPLFTGRDRAVGLLDLLEKNVKPGQFVIGSFFASDNTCPTCRIGYQSSCQQRELGGGAQAPFLRVPLADGTLVARSVKIIIPTSIHAARVS